MAAAKKPSGGNLLKKALAVGGVVVVLAYAFGLRSGQRPASAAPVPIEELQAPPTDSYQLVVVNSDGPGLNRATLQTFEREPGGAWKPAFDAIDARIGRNGFSADRHEGDGTTPSGTFTLTEAFGIKANPGTRLPYRVVGPDDWWISDSSQPAAVYNTWQTHADPVPWNRARAEHLIDYKPSYNHAVVVDFNRGDDKIVGKGSAIFLHVDNGNPTSGCVAIAEAKLAQIMRWLDPTKRPRIMMGTLDQLLKVKDAPTVAAGPDGGLRQVPPTRLLDTRTGLGVAAPGPLLDRTTLDLTVTGGEAAVPADAVAVALNVTLTEQTAPTYLTVYPAPLDPAEGPPLVSNVNAGVGEHRANLVFVKVGAGGKVRVYNPTGRAHVVADVVGYVAPNGAGRFLPATPYRVVDTRTGTGVPNVGKLGTLDPLDVTIPFVPLNASAAVVNVTVTEPTRDTWVAAFQGFGLWQTTSTVNTRAGETSANLAVVPLGPGNTIRLKNAFGAAHVVVDVQGFITPTGARFVAAATPVRVLDTRDGIGWRGRIPAGTPIYVTVPGLPGDATAVAVTVTAVQPSDDTFIRATGAGDTASQSSNVNLRKGETRANLAIVPVGADRRIALTTHSGDVHLVVDVSGWFTPAA